ncbi:MAG: peptide transporter [Gracilibacter sp. BRH_c7a]|nr:MAG: peptide transporter [Gracilibacter sp. BRH_c7a]
MIKLYLAEIDNAKSYSKSFAKNILGESLNVDEKSLVVQENAFGKPHLRDYTDVHYNISHTKGAIVCAVTDKPVGVDIERIRKVNERIVERYFTRNEQNYIFSRIENQDERFTEIWTKKEAYVKWRGKGMTIPFGSFDVLQKAIHSFSYGIYYISIYKKNGAVDVCTKIVQ